MLVKPGGWHIFSVPFMPRGYREAAPEASEDWCIAHCGQWDHRRIFSPDDLHQTLGTVIPLPERYDATQLFPPEQLTAMNMPESTWRGFNNNALFFLRGAADRSSTPAH